MEFKAYIFELYEEGFYVMAVNYGGAFKLYLCHHSFDDVMLIGKLPSSASKGECLEVVQREAYELIPVYWASLNQQACPIEWGEFDQSMDYVMQHDYKEC